MTRKLNLFVLVAILLSACSMPVPTATSVPAGGKCGDGACEGVENAVNCPADCSAPGGTPDAAPVHAEDAPLFITTMTHMEGNWNDDQSEGLFLRHVAQLRYGMDLAEEYAALITIESEKPFARGNTLCGVNIMGEVSDRGFGVGTHCDIGYNDPPMSVEEYAALFVENKSLVDALVGAENNLGCSGGGSVNDWALAASLAGFEYIDGMVAMHYLSMPMENRPGPGWTDEFIRAGNFHLNAPLDLYDRLYPYEVANAEDFAADEDPVILVSSGELGLISAIAERGREYYNGGEVLRDEEYAFDFADVDAIVATILEVDAARDRTRIAKLTVYIPSRYYDDGYEVVLRYFFEQMKLLADQGIVTWATQRQVYEAYMDWNY